MTSSDGTAATGYEYRYKTDGDYGAWTEIPNSANLTSYEVGNLGVGDHSFQLRGRSSANPGVHTAEATATPTAPPSVLATGKVSVDGTYAIGATLSVNIVFSAAVTVSGTPQLALDIGGQTRQADYASGTGTDVLVFSYAVAEGDEDTDGISVIFDGLTLNGGTITAGGTAANLVALQTFPFLGSWWTASARGWPAPRSPRTVLPSISSSTSPTTRPSSRA